MSGSTSMAEVSLKQDTSACFIWYRAIPVLGGLLAFLAVAMAADVRHDLSFSLQGPGLTLDEGFNVETGVYLVESVRAYGFGALHPASLMEICEDPAYNPDHPPFGRIVLGLTHAVVSRLFADPHAEQRSYVISFARLGSVLLFAVTVTCAAWASLRWFGALPAISTALVLILTPRLFAHAHLASLETAMGLTYLLPVLFVADRWNAKEKLTGWDGVVPGMLLGLAFLTKMQAVLLPPVIALWALWYFRQRAIKPLLVMVGLAFLVFFAGWPWLWINPVGHLKDYFLRAADRQVVYCAYFGERYADTDVPWHYPFVMFLVTTPPAFLLAALAGGLAPEMSRTREPNRWTRSRANLMILSTLAPLILFAIPRVSVYDGERLFLIAWLPFAMLAGQGTGVIWEFVTRAVKHERQGRVVVGFLSGGVLLVACAASYVIHPCQLAYYNVLIGGLRGASTMGMELSYWGDGITSEFLDDALTQIPEGGVVDVSPVLHPLQLEFMRTQQTIDRPDLKLRGFDIAHLGDVEFLLVFHRRADQWEILKEPPENWTIVTRTSRSGVPLATMYRLSSE